MAEEWKRRKRKKKNNNNDDDINVLHMKAFIINLCAAAVVIVALRNNILVYGHSNCYALCVKNIIDFLMAVVKIEMEISLANA